MRILFVGAEVAPLAKAGGMGDVIGALPKVLHQLGYDVRIIMPYYGFLDDKVEIPSEAIWHSNAMSQDFSVYQTTLPNSNVPLYLLKHHSFSPRRIYGDDEYWRFTFFSNAAAEFAWNCWKPDIIHCHDWHTGMIPVWMHETPDITTVFTIHNLAYQGPGRGFLEHNTWCPWYMDGDNSMVAGIKFAGRITTVSPTYAEQVQTPAYGERLDGLLSHFSNNLVGILNGIDMELYNPAEDQFIHQTFTSYTLENRTANKIGLQEETGLEINQDAFLMGMVTRLVEQKGIDLILQVLDRFLVHTDAQLVVLGSGDHYYENQLWQLSARYPGRVSVQILYNDVLSRRIFAGADVFLMPSRFEPCGISQLFAMRYGCVPIVRRTGGLKDTVSFYDPINEEGTGYCFDHYDPLELLFCMIRAWEGFRFKDDWTKLQQRCMTQDFSWYGSAAEYIKIYKELTGQPGELTSEEEDKITFLIQQNISWDINDKGNLDENIREDNSEKESTETQTVIKEETTIVEDQKPQESTDPIDSSTITTQTVEVEKEEENKSIPDEVPSEESLSQTTVTNQNASEIEESAYQESSISVPKQNASEVEESRSQESSTSVITTETELNQPTIESKVDKPKLKPRPSLPSSQVKSPPK